MNTRYLSRFIVGIFVALIATPALQVNSQSIESLRAGEITVGQITKTAATAGCMFDSQYKDRLTLFNVRKAIVCPDKKGNLPPNPTLIPLGREEAIQLLIKIPPKYLQMGLDYIQDTYPDKFENTAN